MKTWEAAAWLSLIGALACSQPPEANTAAPIAEAHPGAAIAPVSSGTSANCGAPSLPDCPLQGFMKANALVAINAKRLDRLEEVLWRIAALAPGEYPEWGSIARAGAEAAKNGKLEDVRVSCKKCHEAYRAPYRRDHRLDRVH
jgi:hypothetical protein